MQKVEIRLKNGQIIIGWLKSNNNGMVELSNAYFSDHIEVQYQIFINEKDIKDIASLEREFEKMSFGEEEVLEGEIGEYDQFEVNERVHGIKSDFDESMYTTKLDKTSDFYKKNVESCKKIAKEILQEKSGDRHQLEERGMVFSDDDDEAAYSSVRKVDSFSKEMRNIDRGYQENRREKNGFDVRREAKKIGRSGFDRYKFDEKRRFSDSKGFRIYKNENRNNHMLKIESNKHIQDSKKAYGDGNSQFQHQKPPSTNTILTNDKKEIVIEDKPKIDIPKNPIVENTHGIKKSDDEITKKNEKEKETEKDKKPDKNLNLNNLEGKNTSEPIMKQQSHIQELDKKSLLLKEYIKSIYDSFTGSLDISSSWGDGEPFFKFKDYVRREPRREYIFNSGHYSKRRV